MSSRFAWRSRRIVTPDGVVDGWVVLSAGRIETVASELAVPPSDSEDLGDLAVLPGVIDPHVHLNEPGRAHWEGFRTGTLAAAAGGITTLADMPLNSSPVTTTVEALEAKRSAAAGQCAINVLFHGGLVPQNLDAIEPLIDAGVVGIKAFLCPSGIDEFPAVGEAELRPAMEILARRDVPLLAHAEIVDGGEADDQPVPSPNADSYATWLASRPDRFETAAHELLIRLVGRTGCRVHIVHLATADALPALREARARGLPLSVETCPHYLTFAAEELPDGDASFKCAPPIRRALHREALWAALGRGDVDFIATDHSPAPPSRKSGDLMSAWGGISSLQVALSVAWTGACRRGYGLEDLARWTSQQPARLLGLDGRKGVVAPGFDADLVIFDPEAEWTVVGAELQHRHPQTAYDGMSVRGRVLRTYVGGQKVWPRDASSDGRFDRLDPCKTD
ncbi:MAG: allantoinase AllB [Thermoanaerobaculia bacterium]|nr:allantoinase AllB [Thermoanaerobaculia bacterium]